MEILKIVFLFLAVFFTLVNTVKAMNEYEAILPLNFILQAIGITGFIYLQWLI